MFKETSENITGLMVKNNLISSENSELYRYGVQQFFTILLNTCVTLIIGLLLGSLLESILFTLAYIPIRSYAGGYHSKTPERCCVFSAVMITVVLLIMKYVPFEHIIIFYIAVSAALAVIFVLSPVEDKNKPLDDIEQKVYKKRTLVTAAVEVIIFIILSALKFLIAARCIGMALITMSVMLILGKAKNTFRKS